MNKIQPLLDHQEKQLIEEGIKLAEKQRNPIVRREIELYLGKVQAVITNGKYIIDLYKKDGNK